MELKYQDIETIFLIIFAFVFYFLERIRPYRSDTKKDDLKNDILGFFVVVLSVNICRFGFEFLFRNFNLKLTDPTKEMFLGFRILLALLTMDFILYWIHRGMHKYNWLWNAHIWHHSSKGLYWFSGFRTGFLHAFLYSIPQVYVAFFLFDFTPIEMGLGFGTGLVLQLWTHSNVATPTKLNFLQYFFVTPEFHHPHHSQLGTQNRNFGNLFSLWDWIFGTAVHSDKIRKDYIYGVKETRSKIKMLLGF